MSKRTAESSKAIRQAWLREQELVSEGKGTRDWMPEQQKEILELGKAYYHSKNPDDVNDGKAFEGHHMKSADAYPEYQGDPKNIQFLSRPEHQEAHGGDFRNPTNGYFDPVTKETKKITNKYEPCKVIKLSDPVVSTSDVVHGRSETTEASSKEYKKKKSSEEQRKDNPTSKKTSTFSASIAKPSPKASKSFVEALKESIERHPEVTKVGVAVIAAGIKAIANSKKSSDSGLTSSSGRDYPDERSSPQGHVVSGYDRQQNGKKVQVKPYKRGGKPKKT